MEGCLSPGSIVERRDERRNMQFRRSSDKLYQNAIAFAKSLEILHDGVILVDGEARTSFVSGPAKIILERSGEALTIQNDRLSLHRGEDHEAMMGILAKLGKENNGSAEMLVLERPKLGRPVCLSFFKLFIEESNPNVGFMAVLREPYRQPMLQLAVFTRYFRLSAAETRLCLALVDGLSLSEYSDTFHISAHTARTHLKSIFTKTGTRRQTDLLRLIYSFTGI